MRQKLLLFFKLFFIIFAFIGTVYVLDKNASTPQTQETNGCQVAQNIGDLNKDGTIEHLYFCSDRITINTVVSDGGYYEYKLVEDKNSFPDLFSYPFYIWSKPDKGDWTTKEALVFPKNNPQFFAITSEGFIDHNKAFGIYWLKGKEVKQVFKLGFHDLTRGRSTYPIFSENKPAFQTVSLSLIEKNKEEIVTHYLWNGQKETFEKGEELLNGIPTAKLKEECSRNNGIWMMGPFGEGPFCNISQPDEGKPCNDGSDCLSHICLSYNRQVPGKCSKLKTIYGCYDFIKRERVLGVCVD